MNLKFKLEIRFQQLEIVHIPSGFKEETIDLRSRDNRSNTMETPRRFEERTTRERDAGVSHVQFSKFAYVLHAEKKIKVQGSGHVWLN